ncbi:uncharacterized protein MAM_07752 [Metarhizium album ARSEF 1941]|uniref:Uncharacterized protein n=1 Tax=Metarhizium album (strain ARSEF 1941) TaxID=1081103 RepID=A0A0B2WEX9_METAS|nr:uncharacterized protein MAM_07752 [Metarhizium album ARSEF 1941]KHN94436.1 hypothetical protein MAM_07752 [Metarhizium album ARSEF 1941]
MARSYAGYCCGSKQARGIAEGWTGLGWAGGVGARMGADGGATDDRRRTRNAQAWHSLLWAVGRGRPGR